VWRSSRLLSIIPIGGVVTIAVDYDYHLLACLLRIDLQLLAVKSTERETRNELSPPDRSIYRYGMIHTPCLLTLHEIIRNFEDICLLPLPMQYRCRHSLASLFVDALIVAVQFFATRSAPFSVTTPLSTCF
jgi:hypothetical protein